MKIRGGWGEKGRKRIEIGGMGWRWREHKKGRLREKGARAKVTMEGGGGGGRGGRGWRKKEKGREI